MFILFALQIALVVWIFVKRQQFLNTMGNAVDTAWDKNNDANGYPMDALQMSVSKSLFIVMLQKKNVYNFSFFISSKVGLLWSYQLFELFGYEC